MLEGYPTQYRVLVLTNDVGEDWAPEIVYVAVALEVYIVTQGRTLEGCRRSIERLLVGQHFLCSDMQLDIPRPAPEDYQRLRNQGDWHESPDPKWAKFCGRNPIVARWDINILHLIKDAS